MALISRRIANAASSQVLLTSGQFIRKCLLILHDFNIIMPMLLFPPEEPGPGDDVHEPWLLVESRNNRRIDEEEESGSSMIRATLHKINAWKARHSTYFLQDKKALRKKLQERAKKIAEMVNAAEETARILDDLEQKVNALEDHLDKAEARIQALEGV
ncbi:hypothetical protein AAVH_37315 [Aphelenchoides avenae]|nr:hypothetical protein AAVH_37315 [Aphelenchus avenae]